MYRIDETSVHKNQIKILAKKTGAKWCSSEEGQKFDIGDNIFDNEIFSYFGKTRSYKRTLKVFGEIKHAL